MLFLFRNRDDNSNNDQSSKNEEKEESKSEDLKIENTTTGSFLEYPDIQAGVSNFLKDEDSGKYKVSISLYNKVSKESLNFQAFEGDKKNLKDI